MKGDFAFCYSDLQENETRSDKEIHSKTDSVFSHLQEKETPSDKQIYGHSERDSVFYDVQGKKLCSDKEIYSKIGSTGSTLYDLQEKRRILIRRFRAEMHSLQDGSKLAQSEQGTVDL